MSVAGCPSRGRGRGPRLGVEWVLVACMGMRVCEWSTVRTCWVVCACVCVCGCVQNNGRQAWDDTCTASSPRTDAKTSPRAPCRSGPDSAANRGRRLSTRLCGTARWQCTRVSEAVAGGGGAHTLGLTKKRRDRPLYSTCNPLRLATRPHGYLAVSDPGHTCAPPRTEHTVPIH